MIGPAPWPSVPPGPSCQVADAACPHIIAIRVGRPHDGAEVGVPDREGIRQERNGTGHRRVSCKSWPWDLVGSPTCHTDPRSRRHGCPPTMTRSGQIGATQTLQTRADALGIYPERRDHIHSIRRATQVARVRRDREAQRFIIWRRPAVKRPRPEWCRVRSSAED